MTRHPPDPLQQSASPPASKQGASELTKHTSPLFDAPPAHHNAPPGTSDVAAQRAATSATRDRARILRLICTSGALGMTDDEGQRELGIIAQTYTPRRGELVAAGLVVDSGKRRKTQRGRPAAVWVAVEFGERAP